MPIADEINLWPPVQPIGLNNGAKAMLHLVVFVPSQLRILSSRRLSFLKPWHLGMKCHIPHNNQPTNDIPGITSKRQEALILTTDRHIRLYVSGLEPT